MILDDNQLAAATSDAARICVRAVPGSGKTRTLVARIAYMLERRVPPSEIVCLTFTRYAAREIQSRLGSAARSVFAGTFHSFFFKLISQYGRSRGWDRSWLTILDEAETDIETHGALRAVGILKANGDWKENEKAAWDHWCMEYTSTGVLPTANPAARADIEKYERYANAWRLIEHRLKAENCMTFATLSFETLALLRQPETGDAILADYAHLVVDESQDTDGLQWSFLNTLNPATLFIVGDADQSIYGWRGGQPNLMLDYAKRDNTENHSLDVSYRFGDSIGQPATRLIKHNEERFDSEIHAVPNAKSTAITISDCNMQTLSVEIQRACEPYKARGDYEKHVAILARTHSILDSIADTNIGVPTCHIGGSRDLTKTGIFRAVRGYLRLAVNPDDNRAFMAIATAERISDDNLLSIRGIANDQQRSFLDVYMSETPIETLMALPELPKTLDDIQAYLANRLPDAWHADLAAAINYIRTQAFHEGVNEADTKALVSMLAFSASDQDKLIQSAGKVPLLTIHAAKGLEWDVVFLVGLNDGIMPSARSIREGKGAEEERRLAYVAITRARKHLYAVHLRNIIKPTASPFIKEAWPTI